MRDQGLGKAGLLHEEIDPLSIRRKGQNDLEAGGLGKGLEDFRQDERRRLHRFLLQYQSIYICSHINITICVPCQSLSHCSCHCSGKMSGLTAQGKCPPYLRYEDNYVSTRAFAPQA